MKVIGLIGGIGSGKSTVSQFLDELGAVIIDADRVGHEVYKPDTEAWCEVSAAFGRQILTPSGDIDRKKLGESWTSSVDEVWVTVASESTVLGRLKERGGLSEPQALARIRSQMPVVERVKYADVVINNDGDFSDLKARVSELWHRLHTKGPGKLGEAS